MSRLSEAKGHRDRIRSVFQLPDHQGLGVSWRGRTASCPWGFWGAKRLQFREEDRLLPPPPFRDCYHRWICVEARVPSAGRLAVSIGQMAWLAEGLRAAHLGRDRRCCGLLVQPPAQLAGLSACPRSQSRPSSGRQSEPWCFLLSTPSTTHGCRRGRRLSSIPSGPRLRRTPNTRSGPSSSIRRVRQMPYASSSWTGSAASRASGHVSRNTLPSSTHAELELWTTL